MNAERIKVIGEGEATIQKVMQARRKYEYLNKKLDVVSGLNKNTEVKIFGNNQDDQLSQLAAYCLN